MGRKIITSRSSTRSKKPKLLSDNDEIVLAKTLKEMGLYAANVLGDGNCQFRALSDQMYGSPGHHLDIRSSVCEFLARNAERYRLFVDEDSVEGGFEGHLQSMRRQGTYGTHIELVAFANLFNRPIKVIQPGLVYVIEADEQSAATNGDKGKGKVEKVVPKPVINPLYIVYHNWEHYSSCRNINGPHSGHPNVLENGSNAVEEGISDEEPTELDNQVLRALPTSQARTISLREVRRMIRKHGSVEEATEVLIGNFNGSGMEKLARLKEQYLEETRLSHSPPPSSQPLPPLPKSQKVIIKLSSSRKPTPISPPPTSPSLSLSQSSSIAPPLQPIPHLHPTLNSLRARRSRSLSISDVDEESSESPRQKSRLDSPSSFSTISSSPPLLEDQEEINFKPEKLIDSEEVEIIDGKRPTRSEVAAANKKNALVKTKVILGRGHPAREKKEAARLKKVAKKSMKKEILKPELEMEDGLVVGRVRELFI